LEDGIVVRRADGGFSMLSAEPYASPYAVAMQLGMYTSPDGVAWTRKRTLRVSTGELGTDDLHAAHWGAILTKNTANDTWLMSYVGYKAAKSNASGFLVNYEGTIFARYATEAGDAGLDSDFGEAASGSTPAYDGDVVLLAPDDFPPFPAANASWPKDAWPHQCQGLQGTDSFAPYQLADGTYASFAGTSHEETPNPWVGKAGRWVVSMATAPELSGPWTRYNPTDPQKPADAPCSAVAGGIENPIVMQRPDNPKAFHAVYDGSGNPGFGYACSEDGLAWAPGVAVTTPFNHVRTPYGLVPMSAAEVRAREVDILSYGVLNASQLHAPNTSLQWLFYTGHVTNGTDASWESFSAMIVPLSW
jgi:hypothetical protein